MIEKYRVEEDEANADYQADLHPTDETQPEHEAIDLPVAAAYHGQRICPENGRAVVS